MRYYILTVSGWPPAILKPSFRPAALIAGRVSRYLLAGNAGIELTRSLLANLDRFP